MRKLRVGARQIARAAWSVWRKIAYVRRSDEDEPALLTTGWDRYARCWRASIARALYGRRITYLGDEWTWQRDEQGMNAYGLDANVLETFDHYLKQTLLEPYLPAHAKTGLEIGPGGGRLTALLLPRTEVLHVAEPSSAMLSLLKRRFALSDHRLRYHQTDGLSLPTLAAQSLDYVFAFDVFVHFEPRLVYWYLRQITRLLVPGGTAIVHYANVLTAGGWRQFEDELSENVRGRRVCSAFGVMCPPIMRRFLEALAVDVVSVDLGIIPRDAVAVFRAI